MLRFAVSAPGCTTLTSASLRLTDDADGSVKGGDVYAAGSVVWAESTVTWNNAPARGALVTSLGRVAAGGTYTIDVTRAVTTLSGSVSLRIGSDNADGVHYYSKEGGTATQRPQLTVVCS